MGERPDDEQATPEQNAPTGGDETTEEQLEADNAVEEDTLKALEPDGSPG